MRKDKYTPYPYLFSTRRSGQNSLSSLLSRATGTWSGSGGGGPSERARARPGSRGQEGSRGSAAREESPAALMLACPGRRTSLCCCGPASPLVSRAISQASREQKHQAPARRGRCKPGRGCAPGGQGCGAGGQDFWECLRSYDKYTQIRYVLHTM